MILRRVIAHFRKQEWTAIALDFVIVVVGVFIGIQVANWNEAQAERRLGLDYVERLSADLRNDLAANHALVAYYAAVLESIERADVLLSDPNADTKQLVVSAYRGTEVNYLAQTRATWDQIVSSGHLGLLPDGAVNSGIVAYYAFDIAQDIYRILINGAYRRTVRQIIPIDVQKAIRAGCSDQRNEAKVITGFMQECQLAIDPATLHAIAMSLRTDPNVIADLRYQYSDVISAHINLSGNTVVLESALKALGSETGESNGEQE